MFSESMASLFSHKEDEDPFTEATFTPQLKLKMPDVQTNYSTPLFNDLKLDSDSFPDPEFSFVDKICDTSWLQDPNSAGIHSSGKITLDVLKPPSEQPPLLEKENKPPLISQDAASSLIGHLNPLKISISNVESATFEKNENAISGKGSSNPKNFPAEAMPRLHCSTSSLPLTSSKNRPLLLSHKENNARGVSGSFLRQVQTPVPEVLKLSRPNPGTADKPKSVGLWKRRIGLGPPMRSIPNSDSSPESENEKKTLQEQELEEDKTWVDETTCPSKISNSQPNIQNGQNRKDGISNVSPLITESIPNSLCKESHQEQLFSERKTAPSLTKASSITENSRSGIDQSIKEDIVKTESKPINVPKISPQAISCRQENSKIENSKSVGSGLSQTKSSMNMMEQPYTQSHNPPFANSSNGNTIIKVKQRSYFVLETIGKGGSSKVFRVLSPQCKLYALKRVDVGSSGNSRDAEMASMYMNEIQLLQRFGDCPYVVKLYDYDVVPESGVIHMVMECGDVDLAKLLEIKRAQGMELSFVKACWHQMLQAVNVIHQEKIVHSDLKPANFLLVKGVLKLIDFGIANAIPNDTTNINREQQVGTVNYMSPEAVTYSSTSSSPQEQGHVKLGRPSDVWSLGCILYQMVYGKAPFASITNLFQKIQAIANPQCAVRFDTPLCLRHVEKFNEATVRDLNEVISGCLDRRPKERWTVEQLLSHRLLYS